MVSSEIGRVVCLKTAGPIMTINRLIVSQDTCECIWFTGAQINVGYFKKGLLVDDKKNARLIQSRNMLPLESSFQDDDVGCDALESDEHDEIGNLIVNRWHDESSDMDFWEDEYGNVSSEELPWYNMPDRN